MNKTTYRIAIIKWSPSDGISETFYKEFLSLNHKPCFFLYNAKIPNNVDIVLTYAPYGRLFPFYKQISEIPKENRPLMIHWHMENPPDLRFPMRFIKPLSLIRARIDRMNDSQHCRIRGLVKLFPFSLINNKALKFRYSGEYHFAYERGLLDLLLTSSEIYYEYYQNFVPSIINIPWGTGKGWFDSLNIKRDIDVIWFGTRRTNRRSKLLDRIRLELYQNDINLYVADNIENPFIYGQQRTEFLNRANITLNLLPTWYDNAFPYRFHMAAGNRSLVITEPILPHCSQYKNEFHYISSPIDSLSNTIQYYIENEEERLRITDNAFQLVTKEMTLNNSIRSLLEAVESIF